MSSSLFLECLMWIIMIVKNPIICWALYQFTNNTETIHSMLPCHRNLRKKNTFLAHFFFFFFQIKKISAEAIFKLKKRPQRANESHINGRFMNCIINQSLWEIKVKNILDTTKCYFWCSYGFHFGWNFLLATDIHKMA